MSIPGPWRRTGAWYRGLAVVIGTLLAGLVSGRPDLVLVGAPVALGLALALGSPGGRPGLDRPAAVSSTDVELVRGATALVRTTLTGLASAELITVRLPSATGPQDHWVTVRGGPDRVLTAAFATRRWGPTVLARPDLAALGPDGLTRYGPVAAEPLIELVLPAVQKISPLTLPPIIGGWAGSHTSRRPGQGSDLVDLREFTPGDRMRSVHWRALARHQRLYTRRTLSDADAELMLALDLRTVVGPRVDPGPTGAIGAAVAAVVDWLRRLSDWWSVRHGGEGRAGRLAAVERRLRTSADLTVDAAAAISSAHLSAGDRVGVTTLSRSARRGVRPGTGTRHLQRIRYLLAGVMTRPEVGMLPVALWGLRSGAVVALLTPLSDDEPVSAAVECRGRGHRVIVVDTAPVDGIIAAGGDLDQLRVMAMEHALRADRIRGAGIPVVSWESGSVAAELRAAVRSTRGRR